MSKIQKLVFLSIFSLCLLILSSCLEDLADLKNSDNSTATNQTQIKQSRTNPTNTKNTSKQAAKNCQLNSLKFITTDNAGNTDEQGVNYVIIFDPKSPNLDFKVSMGISHKMYAKDAKGKFIKDYVPKRFSQIITDENALLNGRRPIAAINGDYIDIDNKPQGLNISRGVEYSGIFKDKRSSFGISGGRPQDRIATIQIGKRAEQMLNYNLVGGNGRFYKNGVFKNICTQLGESACASETSRSMVAISSKGYVILLVNNSYLEQALYPDMFDDVLEGIAKNNCLGKIQEGMLFDGGLSTALYFDNKIYVENMNPMGSVFLIYQTK